MITIIKKGSSKEQIKALLENHKKEFKSGIDIKKYCGMINLKTDPVKLQNKWRDEWE